MSDLQQIGDKLLITATQIKAARVALGWGVRDLEKASGISFGTLSRIERGESGGRGTTLARVRKTFEDRGFMFPDPLTVRFPEDIATAARLGDDAPMGEE